MHIKKMGERITEIAILWNDLYDTLTIKAASKEEQEEMRKRILAVMKIYEKALSDKVEYIPNIRKELNSIFYTLKRWQEKNTMILIEYLPRLKIGKK